MPGMTNTSTSPRLIRCVIDEPLDGVIRDVKSELHGWIGSADGTVLERLGFRTSAGPLSFRTVERPDVMNLHRSEQVSGFTAILSLDEHLEAINSGSVTVWILIGDRVFARFHLRFAPGLIGKAIERISGW
jgi:hypothetical protein